MDRKNYVTPINDGPGPMKLIQMCCAAVMLTAFLSTTAIAQDKGRELFQTVLENARQCVSKSRSEIIACYVKATPAKCESLVYEFLDNRRRLRPWYFCVASCADAGYWSRTFGDCARDID